jgi:hypothetical protein
MCQACRGVLKNLEVHDNQFNDRETDGHDSEQMRSRNPLCVLWRAQLHPLLCVDDMSTQQTTGTAVHGDDPMLQLSQAAN